MKRATVATLPIFLGGCIGHEVALFSPTTSYERQDFVPFDGNHDEDCRSGVRDCPPRHLRLVRHGEDRLASGYTKPPVLNVKATCTASSKFQASNDGHFCLTDEYAAQSQLKLKWTTFRAADRRDCVEQSRTLNPSYVETLTCLELSNNTMAANPSPNKSAGRTPSPKTGAPNDTDRTGSIKSTPPSEPPVKEYVVPP